MRGILFLVAALALLFVSPFVAMAATAESRCLKAAGAYFVNVEQEPVVLYPKKEAAFKLMIQDAQGKLLTDKMDALAWISVPQQNKTLFNQKYIVVDGKINLRHSFEKAGTYTLRLQSEKDNVMSEADAYTIVVQDKPSSALLWFVIGAVAGAFGTPILMRRLRARK